jgi:protein PhnA
MLTIPACPASLADRLYFHPSNHPCTEAIMPTIPACPQCTLENTYPDGDNFVCADCGYEWPMAETTQDEDEAGTVVKDANGTALNDGDSVVLIKDLKVKGSSITLKQGTKVKSIRLVGGDHEVDCKMDAGNFMLKAAFLKKV